MDLLKLDPTTFQVDQDIGILAEERRSLIWTERYTYNGEFELQTPHIEEAMEQMPEDTLIGLRGSKEVMFVENHKIAKDEESDGGHILKITGRSFETFLENRITEDWHGPGYGKRMKFTEDRTLGGAALIYIWNVLVNDTFIDAIVPPSPRTPNNVVPNVVVTDSISTLGPSKKRWIMPGPAYPEIIRFLEQGDLGIRSIRPSSGPGDVFSVDDPGGALTVSRTTEAVIDQLRVDVYDGVDRRSSIMFHVKAEHLVNPTYLFSTRAYKTAIFVATSVDDGTGEFYRPDTGGSGASGLARRVGYTDGGSKDDTYTNSEWADHVEAQAEKAFRNTKKLALFDASVSEETPFVYGVDYNLGDLVRMVGQYGLKKDCRVVEYIRSETVLGERSYPTLSRI